MKALVIVGHPRVDSFCHAIAERAVHGLTEVGHEVDTIDLYGVGFTTAMSRDERLAYETDRPILDPQVAQHAELVKQAQILVVVYPTWWSGLPAIVKGWLDRVLVPGVAFTLDEQNNRVKPGLTHVRRIVGISTYGSPWWAVKLVNDNGRRTLTRALRMSCGLRTRVTWMGLTGMDTRSPGDRTAFLAKVEQRMVGLP